MTELAAHVLGVSDHNNSFKDFGILAMENIS